ncbi:MAG: tetratricopeptide repeat protein [Candidatus Acidiferrales bacterium]
MTSEPSFLRASKWRANPTQQGSIQKGSQESHLCSREQMTPPQLEEHNRLYKEAVEIVGSEIIIDGHPQAPESSSSVRSKLDNALQLFSRVIDLNPDNWSAMWFVGKIHQRYGDQSAALEWFARAHDLSAGQVDVLREASLCAMELGRSKEAISYASSALRVRPGDAGLQANLALAFLLAGRLDEAKQSIEKAKVEDPADPIARTLSEMINHFFVASLVRPPSTTKELQKYWARREKEKAKIKIGGSE